MILTALLAFNLAIVPGARAGSPRPPSILRIDAPQLAALGTSSVGFRTITLVHKGQPDFAAIDPRGDSIPLRDRELVVNLWYPAKPKPGAQPVTYHASLYGEPPSPPVGFSVPGIALRDAEPDGRGYPLVIVSHGYGNHPAMMTWLTENLASKGYVVAAIQHDDPNRYVVSAQAGAVPNFTRPVDIAFVGAVLRKTLTPLIDPSRVALVGYSQGGYGVLTAGGARLVRRDPACRWWQAATWRGLRAAGPTRLRARSRA